MNQTYLRDELTDLTDQSSEIGVILDNGLTIRGLITHGVKEENIAATKGMYELMLNKCNKTMNVVIEEIAKLGLVVEIVVDAHYSVTGTIAEWSDEYIIIHKHGCEIVNIYCFPRDKIIAIAGIGKKQ